MFSQGQLKYKGSHVQATRALPHRQAHEGSEAST
jgi:hypothetical protein